MKQIVGNKTDIEYNFVIGEYGVLEGRGWEVQSEEKSANGGYFLYLGVIEEKGLERVSKLFQDGKILGKIESFVEKECDATFKGWCEELIF